MKKCLVLRKSAAFAKGEEAVKMSSSISDENFSCSQLASITNVIAIESEENSALIEIARF
jgi:hypothetical protein